MHSEGRESWLRTTFHRIFCHWSSKAGPEPTRYLRPGPAWTHAGFHTCKDPKIRKHTNVSCLSHIILAFSIHANKWCSQHLSSYFQRAGTSCWLTETFTQTSFFFVLLKDKMTEGWGKVLLPKQTQCDGLWCQDDDDDDRVVVFRQSHSTTRAFELHQNCFTDTDVFLFTT